MATITISWSDSLKALAESQAVKAGFATVSDYLEALVLDAQKQEIRRTLDSRLLEAIRSPTPDIDVTDEYWEAKMSRFAGQDRDEDGRACPE
jgi:hypothetical protein